MISVYRKLYDLLDARERRNAIILFGIMVVTGILNVTGVASVMPFIMAVSDPQILLKYEKVQYLYDIIGFSSHSTFLIFVGSMCFVAFVSGVLANLFLLYATNRFTNMRHFNISSRLLTTYLSRPYSFFLQRHSAEMGHSVLGEAGQVVTGSLMPSLNLLSNSILAIFMIVLLISISPLVSISAALFFAFTYGVIYWSLRGFISSIGKRTHEVNAERYLIIQQSFGNIKDSKLFGLEASLRERFKKPALVLAKNNAMTQLLIQVPRFGLEILVFGAMILLVVGLLLVKEGKFIDILPIIGVYALAAIKIMPAFQNIYSSLGLIKAYEVSLDKTHKNMSIEGKNLKGNILFKTTDILKLEDKISVEQVCFSYEKAKSRALSNVSFEIPIRSVIGIVGASGAGKTTMMDILLGLLSPDEGYLKVDGAIINEKNVRSWQNNLGCVPQNATILDGTVRSNIAFGLGEDKIDQEAVERAAKAANIHDFIVNQMEFGYKTMVGDQGIRLSGGQRQRIAIARALYRDPEVLLFDEATSALDIPTETAVMEAIAKLTGEKTIIIIAHRPETIKICERIIRFENGSLIE